MSIPKRVKRTRVLSTKVTERDNRYMQLMVNRYYEERRINQAKTSTLLRLIVKRFLRRDCPEYEQKTSTLLRLIVKSFLRKRCPDYEQKTSTSYQQEISKLHSAPKGDTNFPHSYLLQKTN